MAVQDYGIKISLPGFDVENAGLNELILHSSYPFLKIVDIIADSFTFTDGSGFNELVYTHNLGYKPRFLLWSTYYDPFSNVMVSDYQPMPLTQNSSSFSIRMHYVPEASTTEIRYSGETAGGDGGLKTINYYCVIYYEEE